MKVKMNVGVGVSLKVCRCVSVVSLRVCHCVCVSVCVREYIAYYRQNSIVDSTL